MNENVIRDLHVFTAMTELRSCLLKEFWNHCEFNRCMKPWHALISQFNNTFGPDTKTFLQYYMIRQRRRLISISFILSNIIPRSRFSAHRISNYSSAIEEIDLYFLLLSVPKQQRDSEMAKGLRCRKVAVCELELYDRLDYVAALTVALPKWPAVPHLVFELSPRSGRKLPSKSGQLRNDSWSRITLVQILTRWPNRNDIWTIFPRIPFHMHVEKYSWPKQLLFWMEGNKHCS